MLELWLKPHFLPQEAFPDHPGLLDSHSQLWAVESRSQTHTRTSHAPEALGPQTFPSQQNCKLPGSQDPALLSLATWYPTGQKELRNSIVQWTPSLF
jgi:hypothetical protein